MSKTAGQDWIIEWGNFAQSTVRVRYADDGIDFSNVIDDAAPNNGTTGEGSYSWPVPTELIGENITVRVLDATEDDRYVDFGPEDIVEDYVVSTAQTGTAVGVGVSPCFQS